MRSKLRIESIFLVLIIFGIIMEEVHAGEDPCSATQLDPLVSDIEFFDNSGYADSGIDPPPYGGYAGADIWFSFEMPASGIVNLILEGGTMTNPAIAIYSGTCDFPKLIYNILDNNCDSGLAPAAVLDQLNPGETYFIRVWAENDSGDGSFSIYLSETDEYQPGFILHSDASELGDCILLTDDINTQHGCAWFEIPIDFTEPFTHQMTANFGIKDANGADGICLIYQSNGPEYCGANGGGIGALGMPNSAIFEFDTYQNGQYNDPANDHAAFNINGDMNHANSIQGPVDLGNIEDGLDHSIEFDYDGSGGYELYFDGNLLFAGSYDFINSIFNGSESAWWGYTAGTGSLNNEHLICPDTEDIELGTQEYIEIEICEGESYNGYTESGFYIDFENGPGNCVHQINIDLTIFEAEEPTYLESTICAEAFIEIEGNIFDTPGFYEITAEDQHGCDSIIYLDLSIAELDVNMIIPTDLNCYNPEVEIYLELDSEPAFDYVDISWDTPSGHSTNWYFIASEPGYYTANVIFSIDTALCEKSLTEFLNADFLPPEISGIEDLYIDCTNMDSTYYLSPVINGSDVVVDWYHDRDWISNQESIEITLPGEYIITAENLSNGCIATDTAIVEYSIDFPVIYLSDTILDCTLDSFVVDIQISGIYDSLSWTKNGIHFSDDLAPLIKSPGDYSLMVSTSSGCTSWDTLNVGIDTIPPTVTSSNPVIPCDSSSAQIKVICDTTMLIHWDDPYSYFQNDFIPTVMDTGWYFFSVENPVNHCLTIDSSYVSSNGNSPKLELHSDPINCDFLSVPIDLNTDIEDLTYAWYYDNLFYDSIKTISATNPGWYKVTAETKYGCSTSDSILVLSNIIYPEIALFSNAINCDNTYSSLYVNAINTDSITWLSPTGSIITANAFQSDIPGWYFVEALNKETGCITYDSIEVIDLTEYPEFELSEDTINCIKPTLFLDLSLLSETTSVEWIFPDQSSSSEVSPLVDEGGTYLLHIEVDGPCDIDTSLTIFEDLSPPVFSLESGIIDCNNPSTFISIQTGDDNLQYSVNSPVGHFQIQSDEYEVTTPGLYIVSAKANNGCIQSDSVYVESFQQQPEGSLSSSGYISCTNPISTISLESNDSIVFYQWDGPLISMMDDRFIRVEQGGTYSLIFKNLHGCLDTLSLSLEEFTAEPLAEITGDTIDCINQTAIAKFNSPDTIVANRWYDINGKIISTDYEMMTGSPGLYYLELINQHGCTKLDSLFIESFTDPPIINVVSEEPIIVKTYEDSKPAILIEIISNSDYVIDWFPEMDLSCYHCIDPVILGNSIEFYTINVTNEHGCIAETEIDIRYKNKTIVTIPNVFTPHNQDNVNDHFSLFSNDNVKIINDLKIFDRWGNLVCHKTNIPPNEPSLGWDGYYRGQKSMKGVYVYYFKITTIDGFILEYSGDLTIL